MRPVARGRRLATWLACVGVLINALAFGFAHDGPDPLGRLAAAVEICSMAAATGSPDDIGSHAASTGHGNEDGSPPGSEHCPGCLGSAGLHAIAPTRAIGFVAPASPPGSLRAIERLLRASRDHEHAQPRAPPRRA